MILNDLATYAGLGRRYYDLSWHFRDPPSARYKPVHDRTQSIFIHVPKTAGVSFHKAMYDGHVDYGHAPAVAFRMRDPDRFARYWKFAFMRDPVDRFVSSFYYLTTAPIDERSAAMGAILTREFGTLSNLVAAMRDSRWTRSRIMNWIHYIPQSWFLTDAGGTVLVDFIGRTESFDATLPFIADRIGVEHKPGRENVSRRSRENELTDDERRFVEALYAKDRILFETVAQDAPALNPGR